MKCVDCIVGDGCGHIFHIKKYHEKMCHQQGVFIVFDYVLEILHNVKSIFSFDTSIKVHNLVLYTRKCSRWNKCIL